MVIRLPLAKLTEMQQLIQDWQKKKSATKRNSSLLWESWPLVVNPGKAFLRRMFELISVARHGHHHIRLNVEFRSDLHWWATFLCSWNGVSILEQYGCQATAVHFSTDASGLFGCGALWSPFWFQLQWPHSYRDQHLKLKEESITLKEILPIVVACAVWAHIWRNKSVMAHCPPFFSRKCDTCSLYYDQSFAKQITSYFSQRDLLSI